MFNRRERHFTEALKRVAQTTDGKIVLAYLRNDEVKRKAWTPDPCSTSYNLGRKEFAMELVSAADERMLDMINLVDETTEVKT